MKRKFELGFLTGEMKVDEDVTVLYLPVFDEKNPPKKTITSENGGSKVVTVFDMKNTVKFIKNEDDDVFYAVGIGEK